jgi:DNA-binding XRE family transcriptional regulator
MSEPMPPAEALAVAMERYRAAVAAVRTAGDRFEARPVFMLDARTLRDRADTEPLARLELARRDARAELHKAAEAAALAGVVLVPPPEPSRAPVPARARAREPEAAPPPSVDPDAGKPWHVRLRLWREREGLNQAQAAERVGTGKSTWSTWELGTAGPPKPTTITRLSELTGIPPAAFLAGEGGQHG